MKQRDWSGIPGEVGGEQAPTMRGGPAGQANQGLALLSRMRSYILVVFEALQLSNIAEGMGETLSVAEHPGNRGASLPYLGTEGATLRGEPLAI